jgi:DeoR family fructose operon transcriptional repressor
MFAHERQQRVLHLLGRRRRLRAQDLQEELKISSATLRRDLTKMEQGGQIVRVHGGVMHPSFFKGEPSLEEKHRSALREKQAIARCVNRDIPAGATLLVDAGSTCLESARLLVARADLTLITNSMPLLQLYKTAQARLIGLGGEIRSISGAMVGPLALEWLQNIRVDFALVGASGLSPQGPSTTELTEMAVKQSLIERADKVLLLADAGKWNQSAAFRFAPWGKIDRFYTSAAFRSRDVAALERQGVEVVRAS